MLMLLSLFFIYDYDLLFLILLLYDDDVVNAVVVVFVVIIVFHFKIGLLFAIAVWLFL